MADAVHIMIGDCSPEYGYTYRSLLAEKGFHVTLTAKNGEELLRQIRKEHPDIVIMEAHMKKSGAAGVIDSLNCDPDIKMPGIIVTSLFYDECLVDELAGLGADCFLQRPFESKLLLEKVYSLLEPGAELHRQGERKENSLTEFEFHLTNIFSELHVPSESVHYETLKEAVWMRFTYGNQPMTKNVYPALAEKYGGSWRRFEKGIRSFIERIWMTGDIDALNDYFGKPGDTRLCQQPTNSHFISVMAEEINRLMLAEKFNR